MFVVGVQGNKICGLMKRVDGSCNKYKTHSVKYKEDVEIAFYLSSNSTNLFLKPLVSLTIVDANQEFLSQVGEDLSKDTSMDIMDKENHTANTSTELFEEVAYVVTITTTGTEVIYELVCGGPGSSEKILKTFVPP